MSDSISSLAASHIFKSQMAWEKAVVSFRNGKFWWRLFTECTPPDGGEQRDCIRDAIAGHDANGGIPAVVDSVAVEEEKVGRGAKWPTLKISLKSGGSSQRAAIVALVQDG